MICFGQTPSHSIGPGSEQQKEQSFIIGDPFCFRLVGIVEASARSRKILFARDGLTQQTYCLEGSLSPWLSEGLAEAGIGEAKLYSKVRPGFFSVLDALAVSNRYGQSRAYHRTPICFSITSAIVITAAAGILTSSFSIRSAR